MKDYLIFRLYGVLSSWGDIAIGDIRPSYSYPSKSAVIGLLSAALGIKRDEDKKLAELFKLSFSVRIDAKGMSIEDYHTIQSPSQQALKTARHNYRADEILAIDNRKEQGAIQSRRTYMTDSVYTIALREPDKQIRWEEFGKDVNSFSGLIQYLRQPKFTLYLGRKSCPICLPLEPQLQTGSNVIEAFKKSRFVFDLELSTLTNEQKLIQYYSEENHNSEMKLSRRDQPVNRVRWQFTDRDEYYYAEQRQNPTRPLEDTNVL